MRFRSLLLSSLVAFLCHAAVPQTAAESPAPLSAACTKRNQDTLAQVAQGASIDAEGMLLASLANYARLDQVCAGVIMSNLAALLLASGRLTEAEAMAARSIRVLEKSLPQNDLALLRPLQILAAIQFEQGKTTRAREAFQRMEALRTTRPEDRELVNAMAASLLEAEGRWREAESHYAAAIQALKDAGRGDTSDAGALLNGIGGLYIKEHRMAEAHQALDDALAIFERARDATPWDRIKLLHTRAALYGRQGMWKEAEQDLANAVTLADRDPPVASGRFRFLLMDYAAVLRKNHRSRDARAVETRIAALARASDDRWVVDAADLTRSHATRGDAR